MEASIRFVVSNNSGKLPAVVHGPHAKRVSAAVVDDNIVAFGNVHWERYAAIQVISRKTERSSDTKLSLRAGVELSFRVTNTDVVMPIVRVVSFTEKHVRPNMHNERCSGIMLDYILDPGCNPTATRMQRAIPRRGNHGGPPLQLFSTILNDF